MNVKESHNVVPSFLSTEKKGTSLLRFSVESWEERQIAPYYLLDEIIKVYRFAQSVKHERRCDGSKILQNHEWKKNIQNYSCVESDFTRSIRNWNLAFNFKVEEQSVVKKHKLRQGKSKASRVERTNIGSKLEPIFHLTKTSCYWTT